MTIKFDNIELILYDTFTTYISIICLLLVFFFLTITSYVRISIEIYDFYSIKKSLYIYIYTYEYTQIYIKIFSPVLT